MVREVKWRLVVVFGSVRRPFQYWDRAEISARERSPAFVDCALSEWRQQHVYIYVRCKSHDLRARPSPPPPTKNKWTSHIVCVFVQSERAPDLAPYRFILADRTIHFVPGSTRCFCRTAAQATRTNILVVFSVRWWCIILTAITDRCPICGFVHANCYICGTQQWHSSSCTSATC